MRGSWGAMGWGWVFLLLVVVGVVLIVVAVVRSATTRSGGDVVARRRHAEELLAERYARGEIETAEYEERLRTLRGG